MVLALSARVPVNCERPAKRVGKRAFTSFVHRGIASAFAHPTRSSDIDSSGIRFRRGKEVGWADRIDEWGFIVCSCSWSALVWRDIQPGARTERRGDARPARLLLRGETRLPKFYSTSLSFSAGLIGYSRSTIASVSFGYARTSSRYTMFPPLS